MKYKAAALIIIAVFYSCFLLKAIRQKRQGIRTDQLGKGKTGFPKVIEILLKIFSMLTVITEIISVVCCQNDSASLVRTMGLVLSAAGTLLFIRSMSDMKDNWRAGVSRTDKTELVTDGVYRWSRNPAFLGFDLYYIGLVMSFFNWWLLTVTVITILLLHLQIVNVEEDFLLERFGDEYLKYRKRTNRYFGRHNTED